MNKKIVFVLIALLFCVNFRIISNTIIADQNNKDLITAGFSVFCAGLGALVIATPMSIAGSLTSNFPLMFSGVGFYSVGMLSSFIIGPILTLVGYNSIYSKAGIVENNLQFNSNFWYGMGWASIVTGSILSLLATIVPCELAIQIILFVFGSLSVLAGFSFWGVAVTMPFVNISL